VTLIKAIERVPGLKQHQMVKSNKKIAGTEYYDTNNDLQVEDLVKLENYLCRQSQRYKGVVRTSSILKSFPFSPRKRLTENCLGQSKDLESDGGN
jgi:hypothetical protein